MASRATKKPKARTKTVKRPRAAAKRPVRRQPESLRLRAVAASLTVADLERSLAWYRDVLGFTLGERWEEGPTQRGVQLKAGSCQLLLNQDDFAKGRDRKKGEGCRVWLWTVQDLDVIAQRAQSQGITLDYGPVMAPWGAYAFAITDPDGFKLTLARAVRRSSPRSRA